MTAPSDDRALSPEQALHRDAYDSFDAGRLDAAANAFARLFAIDPSYAPYAYMLGLAHKYRFDWAASLAANLRSQALRDTLDEASVWNAGIAATALGDDAEARRQWARVGIRLPEVPGDAAFGDACARLNPWADGEVVWIRRLGPCHGRVLSVPLPESGWRHGDIVLHDGASTGRRRDAGGHEVPVFNAMQRLARSPFRTFSVFVAAPSAARLAPLLTAGAAGIGHVEDWTGSVATLCRRCSYGLPHVHHDADATGWRDQRTLGIAAEDRAALDAMLATWPGAGVVVEAIDDREFASPAPADGQVWWNGDDEPPAD